jgi:hypothetical protein
MADLLGGCSTRCAHGRPPHSDRYVDATDVLPGLLEDEPGCGRHCHKMLAILSHLRGAASLSSSPPAAHSMLVVAEDAPASACVLLEGNHR